MSRDEKQFKKAVLELCNQLRWRFYLNAYKMHLSWCLDEDHDSSTRERKVAAEIQINNAYLWFEITFYREALRAAKRGELFEILVHEFSHSLTEPLYSYAARHLPEELQPHYSELWERQTELIARLLYAPKEGSVADLRRMR